MVGMRRGLMVTCRRECRQQLPVFQDLNAARRSVQGGSTTRASRSLREPDWEAIQGTERHHGSSLALRAALPGISQMSVDHHDRNPTRAGENTYGTRARHPPPGVI